MRSTGPCREIEAAVAEANRDGRVHVIVLRGGRAFCAGYDLDWGTRIETEAQRWRRCLGSGADLRVRSQRQSLHVAVESPKP